MSSVTQYQAKQVLPGIVFAHLQPSEDKGLKSQEKDFGALRTSSHSPPPIGEGEWMLAFIRSLVTGT